MIRRFVPCLAMLMLLGCSSGNDDAKAHRIDLTPAKQFKRFTLFYLGHSYGDLPLTDDGGSDIRLPGGPESVGFVYGTCETDPDSERSSCFPPLSVGNWPACALTLADYRPRPRVIQLRGVPVADFGDHYEVFTGKTTVVIHAWEPSMARRAVRGLRSLNRKPRIGPGDDLPHPAPGVLEGKLKRCGTQM